MYSIHLICLLSVAVVRDNGILLLLFVDFYILFYHMIWQKSDNGCSAVRLLQLGKTVKMVNARKSLSSNN